MTSICRKRPSIIHIIGLRFSKCGPWTRNTGITWNYEQCNSQALPQNQKLEMRLNSPCFSSPSSFWCTLNSDNDCYSQIVGLWAGNCLQGWHHFFPSVLNGCFGLTVTCAWPTLEPWVLWRCDDFPIQTLSCGGRVGRSEQTDTKIRSFALMNQGSHVRRQKLECSNAS